jgi:hypothetical protein
VVAESSEEDAGGKPEIDSEPAAGSGVTKESRKEGPPPPGAQSGRRMAEDGERSQRDTYNIANNFFNAVHSVEFGPQAGPGDQRAPRSGKVDAGEVADILDCYVEPPGFDEAMTVVRDHRVVIITGAQGSGRRCGAMALLRGLVEGDLTVLPPKLSVGEIAGYRFEASTGYLLQGIDEHGGDEEATGWRSLRKQLADLGSYLVITADTDLSGRRTRGRPDQLPWHRPDLAVILAYFLQPPQREEVRAVLEQSGQSLSMSDLHAFLSEVATGVEVAEAAVRFLDTTTRHTVADWFDSAPEPTRVADVVVAAFFPDIPERDFELIQGTFLDRIAPELPADRPDTEPAVRREASRTLNSGRKDRWDGSSLLGLRNGGVASAVRHVDFKDDKYRSCVLEELDRRFDRRFWSDVADWLTETVGQVRDSARDELLVQLGQSLALLARTALPEVEDSYLDRWSRLEPGSPHQQAVVYTLHWMSCLDDLDDYALGTARHWARRGGESQRWAAAVSLGGALGLAYPAEAINELWRLVERDPRSPLPSIALATLFGLLVETESPYANRLLTALHTRLQALTHTGAKDQAKLIAALWTTVWVLAEHGSKKSLPRSIDLLRIGSARTQTRIGQLWAATLLHLAVRAEAAEVLVDALRLLSEADPADLHTIDLLGRLIHQSLRPDQVPAIRQTLMATASRKRRAASPVISILLRWFNPSPSAASLA